LAFGCWVLILISMAKPVLGRGLSALLGASSASKPAPPPAVASADPTASPAKPAAETAAVNPRDRVLRVAIQRVQPCSFQPRKDFPEEALLELSQSIKEQGILQPMIVRPRGVNFELIAGERRLRAAQMAGLTEVPVLVMEADDRKLLELALIENLQREDLNPIEEAMGYAQLIEQFHLKQEEAADRVGKSRAAITNALRLLKLPTEIVTLVRERRLTVGHAKVLLGLETAAQQQSVAQRIMAEGLSVRETEAALSTVAVIPPTELGSSTPSRPVGKSRDAHVEDLENKLRERFGGKVAIKYQKGKGSLQVYFHNDDDFERILKVVGISID
jgi:ParB family chromosome partitioning protein